MFLITLSAEGGVHHMGREGTEHGVKKRAAVRMEMG